MSGDAMDLLRPQASPLWLNLLVLAIAAGAIWLAGSRMAEQADEIARRTPLSDAFVGLLVLRFATSPPELATTVTASFQGNAPLAANTLLGGVAMQTAVIALADYVAVRGALSFFTPRAVLLLQAVLLVALLGGALAAISAGELVAIGHVGLWSTLLFVGYLVALRETYRYGAGEQWQATRTGAEDGAAQEYPERRERDTRPAARMSDARLYISFGGLSIVILVAGWVLAETGAAVAEQTGLGQSFVGVTLLALATTLPEITTTLGAARLGNYTMAFSNIFGSNAVLVALFFISDLAYAEGLIIDALDRSAEFAAALGIVVTCVYLWGLLERRDRTVGRMGIDSALVVALYLGGLVVLYVIRGR